MHLSRSRARLIIFLALAISGASAQVTAPTEPVGTASPTQTATISFTGSFTLGSVKVVTQGATGLDFNAAAGGTCTVGNAYTASSTCTVNFTFTPQAPGRRIGAILVSDNSATPVLESTVFLGATGTGPLGAFTPGIINTIATATSPTAVAVDAAGNVYYNSLSTVSVYKLAASTGTVTTIAGNGTTGYNGDNIPATTAELGAVASLALDGAGNLYIATTSPDVRIREVNASSGIITTVFGDGSAGTALTEMNNPGAIVVDAAADLYIADSGNKRVLLLPATHTTATATLVTVTTNVPYALAVDAANNLYIAGSYTNGSQVLKVVGSTTTPFFSTGNDDIFSAMTMDAGGDIYLSVGAKVLEFVAATGALNIVAGPTFGTVTNVSDGIPATAAFLNTATVAVDGSGNLYLVDQTHNLIRKISVGATQINWGSIPVNTSNGPQPVTYSSIGNASIISNTPTSGTNASLVTPNFNFDSTTTCPDGTSGTVLAAGTNCLFAINFKPTVLGALTAPVSLADNAPGSPHIITLNGLGSSFIIAPTQANLGSLTAGVAIGSSFNVSVSSGGKAPFTYSIISGALPVGVSFSSTGYFSGTATATGTYNFTVQVVDSSSPVLTNTISYALSVLPPTITVSPSTTALPNAIAGTPYSQTFTASGGVPPYTYAFAAGAIPTWLTLNATTGVLTGTPPSGSTNVSFSVNATDSTGGGGPYTGTRAYTLTVNASVLVISPATLTNAVVDTAYSATFATANGISPYTYAITSGTLPPGYSLTSAGVLSGNTTAGGVYPITLQSTDSSSTPLKVSQSYNVVVGPPSLGISPGSSTIPLAIVGQGYTVQFTGSGGTPPYTFTMMGYPFAGLTLTSTGLLSGYPQGLGNQTALFYITVRDSSTGSGPYTATATYTMQFQGGANAVTVAQVAPTPASAGTGVGVPTSFTATVVSEDYGGGATPTGYVLFYNGSASMGSAVPLNSSGVATLSGYTFTSAQTALITARYAGDVNYVTSLSNTVVEAVSTPNYAAVFSPNSLTIASGGSGTTTLTLTPVGFYAGTATFSCANLPTGATCTFTPSSVTFAGDDAVKTSTLVIATTAGHAIKTSSILWLPGILLTGLLFIGRRRFHASTRATLLLLLLACFGLSLTACGGATPAPGNATPPGTTSVTVAVTATATAGSGSSNSNQSAVLTITIQ